MTWLNKVVLWLLVGVILCGCRGHANLVKETTSVTHEVLRKNVEYWEEVEDTFFALPVAPLRGDSMTIPPLPPAPSFHYVWLAPSEKPSAPALVPVAVRHSVKRGAQADSVLSMRDSILVEKSPDLSPFLEKIRFWKWCSGIFFLILCCITCFFIWIYRKK